MEIFHYKEQDFFHTKRSEIDRIDFGDVPNLQDTES